MEKGFNSDIYFRGSAYHVQSEDWGVENPFLVSRVFKGGAVVRSIKTPYLEALGISPITFRRVDPQAIRLALQNQHQKILDLLVSGQLL